MDQEWATHWNMTHEDYTVGCVTFPKTKEGYINFLKAQRDYLIGRRATIRSTVLTNVFYPGEYERNGPMVMPIKKVDLKRKSC